MCLLSCLSQNIPVPEFNYPMYTAAMLGLVVTCSGLEKSQKVSDGRSPCCCFSDFIFGRRE